MKKSRKLVLSRETLHSLELQSVAGGGSIAVCTTLQGTTKTTGGSGTYTATAHSCGTEVCTDYCETGESPCTADSYCQCL